MTNSVVKAYRSDSFLLSLASLSPEEYEANRTFVASRPQLATPPNTALWFIPWVDNALRGGVRTIFMVAEHLSEVWGTQNLFVIDEISGLGRDVKPLVSSIRLNFPKMRFVVTHHDRRHDNVNDLPSAEIAFCTLWTTAYLLAKYSKCRRKFYFVQDFEPMFYPAGSVYGCIEATYRFGFDGIVNTNGVYKLYSSYGNRSIYFTPGIDHSIFNAHGRQEAANTTAIVVYGRPNNHRNGFALCSAILRRVKAGLGDTVRIVSAGADWAPADFELTSIVNNMGTLTSLKEVATLYRSSHLGLALMFTPHPSYQPLEYMACGCIPVTNINPANDWLLRDNENCLTVEAIPEIAAAAIIDLARNPERMAKLRLGAQKTVQSLRWSNALDEIASFIVG